PSHLRQVSQEPGNARCSGRSLEWDCLWDQNARSRVQTQSTKRKPDFIRTANNGSFYTTNRANCPESFHGDAFTYYPKHRSRRAAGHAQCERDFSFCSVHSPPRFHCDLSIRDRLSTPAISCRRYNSQRQPLTHFIIRATHSLLPA